MEVANDVYSVLSQAAGITKGLTLLTPGQGVVNVLIIVATITLIAVSIWLEVHKPSRVRTVGAALIPAVVLGLLLLLPQAYRGTPDDRCDEYDDGDLTFIVLDASIAPVRAGDISAGEWLILTVLAPERWKDDTHTCRLSMSDEKIQKIWEFAAKALSNEEGNGHGTGLGLFEFTFGGEAEQPNVTWKPEHPPPGKPVPPESPSGQA